MINEIFNVMKCFSGSYINSCGELIISDRRNELLLLQSNGKPWLTDEDKTVPKKCPICGADMGLFLMGEPVFLCKGKDRHYYGTLKFTEDGDTE